MDSLCVFTGRRPAISERLDRARLPWVSPAPEVRDGPGTSSVTAKECNPFSRRMGLGCDAAVRIWEMQISSEILVFGGGGGG